MTPDRRLSRVRGTAPTRILTVYVSNSDFGGKLRRAREQHGVSLRQIAAATKIPVAALEALERNDLSKLPGGIFSRGFVRSYAIEVGLDPDRTVNEFVERFHSGRTPVAPPHPPPRARSRESGRAASRPHEDDRAVPHRRAAIADGDSEFESRRRMAAVVMKLTLISIPLAGFILYMTLGRNVSR